MKKAPQNLTGYNFGHPWYYVLGGEILSPKQIRAEVSTGSYQGYMAEEINAVDNKTEPHRSEALRAFKAKFLKDLAEDISCYRQIACAIRQDRVENPIFVEPDSCADSHGNVRKSVYGVWPMRLEPVIC
jgi:hypothetical protein